MNDNYLLRLNSVSIENFRIFKERQHFKFAPITILVGPNGSGKSTLLKFIEFLRWNSKENRYFPQELKAKHHEIGLSTFDHITNKETKSNMLNFSLKFNMFAFSKRNREIISTLLESSSLNFKYKIDRKTNVGHLKKLDLALGDKKWFEIEQNKNFEITVHPEFFLFLHQEISRSKEIIKEIFSNFFPEGRLVMNWEKRITSVDLDLVEEKLGEEYKEAFEIFYEVIDLLCKYHNSTDWELDFALDSLLKHFDECTESYSFNLTFFNTRSGHVFFQMSNSNIFIKYLWDHFQAFIESIKNYFTIGFERIDAERSKVTRYFEREDKFYLAQKLFQENIDLRETKRWVEFLEIGEDVSIQRINDDLHRRIIISKNGEKFDLCDLGYGLYHASWLKSSSCPLSFIPNFFQHS